MKRKYLDAVKHARELLKKNAKLRAEYNRLKPEFLLIEKVIEARMKKNLTQKKLAAKLKTKQSVISRLESGRANPTYKFMEKLAAAFDSVLEINFRPLTS